MLVALLGTLGAGLGLSLGLVVNMRLAAHTCRPVLASLVNFVMGLAVSLALLALRGGASWPGGAPLWTLFGGVVGAAYVTLTLLTAQALGVAISTAGVTLGQILGARVIDACGLLGQPVRPVSAGALLGAVLLLGAVALLARQRASSEP